MSHYPSHLNLAGRRCLVVGGGRVAERKVRGLIEVGARVVVIAPEIATGIGAFVETGMVDLVADGYTPEYLTGAFLVIAATDDPGVNAAVVRDARERRILVCRVDRPDDGDFITPAVVNRGDLMLTVSTSGKSPTLAAVVADLLEEKLGNEWAGWTELFGRLREDVKRVEGGEAARKAVVRKVMDDAMITELIKSGNVDGAEERARQCL